MCNNLYSNRSQLDLSDATIKIKIYFSVESYHERSELDLSDATIKISFSVESYHEKSYEITTLRISA